MIMESSQTGSEESGILYKQLYRKCIGSMLVTSDNKFREIMVELMDHFIIHRRKSDKGEDCLFMPLEIINEVLSMDNE